MKKHIIFFLKQRHYIAVLHIANVWFAANDDSLLYDVEYVKVPISK